jgi:diphosphomevalonate decarboxylase
MRDDGIPVFFTIDAGPQLKAVCPTEEVKKVQSVLLSEKGVKRIIKTSLGGDAIILEEKE